MGAAVLEGSSVMFYAANLNKRSVALDVKRARRPASFVDSADVFLPEPAAGILAERIGFGEQLRARKPLLVYCDIFNAEEREAGRYDASMQGYEKAATETAVSLTWLNFGQTR